MKIIKPITLLSLSVILLVCSSVKTFRINRSNTLDRDLYFKVLDTAYRGLPFDTGKFIPWIRKVSAHGIVAYSHNSGASFDPSQKRSYHFADPVNGTGGAFDIVPRLFDDIITDLRTKRSGWKRRTEMKAAYIAEYMADINMPYHTTCGKYAVPRRGIFNIEDWTDPYPAQHFEFARLVSGFDVSGLTDTGTDEWPGSIDEYIRLCSERTRLLNIVEDFNKYVETRDMAYLITVEKRLPDIFNNAVRAVRTVWYQLYLKSRKKDHGNG